MTTITKICNFKIEDGSVYYQVKWGKTWVLAHNIPQQFKSMVDDFWNDAKGCGVLSTSCCNPKKRKLNKTNPVISPKRVYPEHKVTDTTSKLREVVSFETVVTKPPVTSPRRHGRGRKGPTLIKNSSPMTKTDQRSKTLSNNVVQSDNSHGDLYSSIDNPVLFADCNSNTSSCKVVNPISPFYKDASLSLSPRGRVAAPSKSTRGRGRNNLVSYRKFEGKISSFDYTIKKEMSPTKSIAENQDSDDVTGIGDCNIIDDYESDSEKDFNDKKAPSIKRIKGFSVVEIRVMRKLCKNMINGERTKKEKINDALADTEILQKFDWKQIRTRIMYERRLNQ